MPSAPPSAAGLPCLPPGAVRRVRAPRERSWARHGGSIVDDMPPKGAKPRVSCTRPGCSGSCPLRVVLKSLEAGGTPAKCFECGRLFKKPPGVGADAEGDRRGGGLREKELQRLRDELKALRSKRDPEVSDLLDEIKAFKAKQAATTVEPEAKASGAADADLKAQAERLSAFIQDIQSACDKSPTVEHKRFLEDQRAKLRELRKQQDAGLAWHKRLRKHNFRVLEAAKKVDDLKEYTADLCKEREEVEARQARIAAKLGAAQQSLLQEQAVAQKLSSEAGRGGGRRPPGGVRTHRWQHAAAQGGTRHRAGWPVHRAA